MRGFQPGSCSLFALPPQPSPCCCPTSPREALACIMCLSRSQESPCPPGSPRPAQPAPTQVLALCPGRVTLCAELSVTRWQVLPAGSALLLWAAGGCSLCSCSQKEQNLVFAAPSALLSSGNSCSPGILSDLCHFSWKEQATGFIAGFHRFLLQVITGFICSSVSLRAL